MTTNSEYTQPGAPPPAPPAYRPPLRRSRQDRVIAGVAGGFARWLGIDPVIVRVILVVLAVFGGSGLLLYVIGWLFIPDDDAPQSEAERFIARAQRPGSSTRTVLLVIAVVVGVILFSAIVSSAFGNWGGFGSFLLLLSVGALVLYLATRPSSAMPQFSPAPVGGPVPPTEADDAASQGAQQPVQSTVDPGATAVAAPPPPPAAPPTAYAYGGSGSYPGYTPPVPAPVPPTPPRPRSYLGLATLSIAILVTGVLVTLDVTGVVDLAPVIVPGVALLILGAGILVGAWVGRARWLLWFAIPTLFVTMIASFIPANFDGRFNPNFGAGVGQKFESPMTVLEAREPFELGVGQLQLDLTDLAIPAGVTTVPIDATVGLGELIVTVPDDVRVLVDADSQLGELRIDGVAKTNDPSPSYEGELPGGPATGPVLDLTLHTNVGAVEVSRA
jgi:phage shock protein PspC (stress-responsive transcriptional regulator)